VFFTIRKKWGDGRRMRNLDKIKKILQEHKEEIRRKYGVVILGVFGSILLKNL